MCVDGSRCRRLFGLYHVLAPTRAHIHIHTSFGENWTRQLSWAGSPAYVHGIHYSTAAGAFFASVYVLRLIVVVVASSHWLNRCLIRYIFLLCTDTTAPKGIFSFMPFPFQSYSLVHTAHTWTAKTSIKSKNRIKRKMPGTVTNIKYVLLSFYSIFCTVDCAEILLFLIPRSSFRSCFVHENFLHVLH